MVSLQWGGQPPRPGVKCFGSPYDHLRNSYPEAWKRLTALKEAEDPVPEAVIAARAPRATPPQGARRGSTAPAGGRGGAAGPRPEDLRAARARSSSSLRASPSGLERQARSSSLSAAALHAGSGSDTSGPQPPGGKSKERRRRGRHEEIDEAVLVSQMRKLKAYATRSPFGSVLDQLETSHRINLDYRPFQRGF
mmetsp:Transcript_99062/g.275817  ORF Transcript_99062/g.275817 Transcript_99062/m.275817 type:complete len:194 (+) Transcript_99062:160-741(+)